MLWGAVAIIIAAVALIAFTARSGLTRPKKLAVIAALSVVLLASLSYTVLTVIFVNAVK
jgi:hypothetical protein